MPARIVFRVDASRQIGTGHVMRCLALAEALRRRDAEPHFISRELPGDIRHAIRQQGHPLHVLPRPARSVSAGNGNAHAHWLEVPESDDAKQSAALLAELGRVDLLIVDHYALSAGWETALRDSAETLCVIDDLADRPHDCDLLLDQTPDAAPRYEKLVPTRCRLLAGPAYALLRAEFAQWHSQVKPRHGQLRRMLVCFGGVDPANHTATVVEALKLWNGELPSTDVVAGMANPHVEALRSACAGHPRLNFLQSPPNLAELMARADLAIGAGGVMLWERASLGLPSVAVVAADNQRPVMKALVASGQIVTLEAAEATPEAFARVLGSLSVQPERLAEMSRRNHGQVDGRGCERVARVLLPPAIALRRAVESDRDALFQWRNAEAVRRHSNDPRPIPREAHDRWFPATLQDAQKALLIAEHEGQAVGVLRYDLEEEQALVSIYLVPGQGGQGYGSAILQAGKRWLQGRYPGIRCVNAEILPGNAASRRAFEEAGYRLEQPYFRQYLQE